MNLSITFKDGAKTLVTIKDGNFGVMEFSKKLSLKEIDNVARLATFVASSCVGSVSYDLKEMHMMSRREAIGAIKKASALYKKNALNTFNKLEMDSKPNSLEKEYSSVNVPRLKFLGKIVIFFAIAKDVIAHLPEILTAMLNGYSVGINVLRMEQDDKELMEARKEGGEAVNKLIRKRIEIERLKEDQE